MTGSKPYSILLTNFEKRWTKGWSSAEFFRPVQREIGAAVAKRTFQSGWTTNEAFATRAASYLVGYKKSDGKWRTRSLAADGKVGPVDEQKNLGAGWTLVRPYRIGDRSFLMLLSRTSGKVEFHELGDDCRLGSRILQGVWSKGWTTAESGYALDSRDPNI